MEEFLNFVLAKLVDYPDDVIVTRHDDGRKVLFLIKVRQSDVGAVIGRNGQVIAAIRALVSAAAAKQGVRAKIEIIED